MIGLLTHPGGNPGANLKSISHRCFLREVSYQWVLTEETICLPLSCLQGGTPEKRGSRLVGGAWKDVVDRHEPGQERSWTGKSRDLERRGVGGLEERAVERRVDRARIDHRLHRSGSRV